ncbi:hypothetical protein MJG53_019825 [Ovis ammon polii x Ovis aries]|uniref:Uncharacterized protein n=1 Tax=Ovis ammon polii x Ovis aries TaxID=2918886 RepID=A0ACB9U0K7_9CETA|nr:hypothetical protein MJG53_019825 [Ovis ammon polii x Ovis aries]
MTEHGLASTLTEMPLLTPLINGDPIHQSKASIIQHTTMIANATSTSNTASAHVEISHGNKCINPGSEDIKQKPGGKQSKSLSSNTAEKGKVSDIQTSSAVISWKTHGSEKCNHTKPPVTFELAISNSGKNGKYTNVYTITTVRGSAHRTVSKVVSFTTPGCKPDPPLAPKLINRSKSSLNLQWKGSNGNGSKINSFLLEWDEGKGEDFKTCYIGTMKQHKILKLNASTKYSFRLAAKNKFGLSDFSEIAVFHTSGTMPPTPSPPKLKEAGVCNLSLEWCAPTNTNPNDSLTYVLEMEEAGLSGSHSVTCETAPVPSPPTQCGIPVLTCKSPTCVVVSWEAVNIVGVGMFGETGIVTTPATVPAAVTVLQEFENKVPANLASSCIAIQWEEPDCHGSAITGYNIEYGHRKIVTVSRVTECLLKNLQPDTTYRFTKDQTHRSPFPTFSQIHITTSKSALDVNIRILLGYKSSGDNAAQLLFSQPISNSQGLAKMLEEGREAALVKRNMKSPR